MGLYNVVGVDLSKSSTGISIAQVDNGNLSIVDNYSIKPIKQEEFTKLHFYVKNMLMIEIAEIFNALGSNFTVAFEFPVFSNYTSELQYYITQEFLNLCHSMNINTVGYSPSFLKKFIKLFVTDGRKYSSYLDKPEIRDIYERYVYPLNADVLPESLLVKDDDSMDALFLSILGSILQAYYLKVPPNEYPNIDIDIQRILNHRFDYLLLTNCNYYRDKYLSYINEFEFHNFKFNNEGVIFGKQFKGLIKDSKDNKHLTLGSRMFFPFGIMNDLTKRMKRFRVYETENFYEFWTKYLGSRVSYLKNKFPLDQDFECLINKRGHYFLYPVGGCYERR